MVVDSHAHVGHGDKHNEGMLEAIKVAAAIPECLRSVFEEHNLSKGAVLMKLASIKV